ncbi:MAG: T9SS type A sorting domain-containing protein [Saprospiraceae bacterium]|nr:T9SS type A sorting domain-containing protein [Saprospiraceae bacterium]
MKKFTLLFCSFLCFIFSQAQIPTYVPTNGLVGYWPFNGNANDESGNGNNGTVNGGVALTTDRLGNSNSCYLFPGSSNSYIDCGSSPTLQISGPLSISGWFYMDGGTINPRIISYEGNGGYTVFCDGTSNSDRILHATNYNTGGSGTGFCCSSSQGVSVLALQWHHFVYTADVNGFAKLYIDGAISDTITGVPVNSVSYANTFNIGRKSQSEFDAWGGKLDDIGIWNRVLTQQEIVNLYNSQSCSAAITLNGPSSFCFGQNQNIGLSVDSSGTTYKKYIWSTGDTTPSIIVRPTQTTKYKVTVIQNGETCKDSITITVNAKPTVSPTSTPATICQGQSSTLAANATAGSGTISSYSWSSGLAGNVSGGNVSPNSTTTYTVTVRNSNGCSSTASTTVTVNVKPSVSPTATPSTICQGQSSTLAANATAGSGTISSYAWSSGLVGNVSGGTVSPNSTATYTVTVRNSNSCTVSASVIVNVNPLPVVNINSFPAFININATPITLSGSPSGGSFSGQGVTGSIFNPTTAGLGKKQITYTYTNVNNCTNTANGSTIVYDTTGIVCHTSVTDTLIINTVLTGVSPPNNINTIKIYPNPSSDHLNINTGNYSLMNGYTIKIINPLSQVVFQNLINQQFFNISLSGWSHGSYIIQILDTANVIIETKILVLQ